jgi:hypothetical protein
MKTVILIRFGTPQVLPKEKQLFDQIAGEARVGIAGALGQVAIIAAFKTSLSPHKIATMYEELADSTSDRLPTLVAHPEDIGLNFKDFGFDEFMEAFQSACAQADIEESAPQSDAPIQVCTLSLDDLLDLVSAKGIKNLTTEESARLQELSK